MSRIFSRLYPEFWSSHHQFDRPSYKMSSHFVILLVLLFVTAQGKTLIERINFDGDEPKYTVEDGPFGGSGGSPWTDGGPVHLNGPITAMDIRAGAEVDQIRVRYGDVWGDYHGTTGGTMHNVEIHNGTDIVIVQGRSGRRIDSLEFIGSDGQIYGSFGGTGGTQFKSSHLGCALRYLSGSSGERLDSITLHWECPDQKIEQNAEIY